MISCPRVTIAGLGGDSGKTAISVGLCRAWQSRGLIIVPFKKGPDYIDMAWLRSGARNPCYNIDLFLMNKKQVLGSFIRNTRNCDIAVIEGNRGLYDGIDEKGSVSTAEVSKLLQSPVILVVDCTKVTRTVAALIHGCQTFDADITIKGVILNKLAGSRHEAVVRKSVKTYCSLPVIGAIPKLKDISFPGRHLGLVPPQEYPMAEEAINTAALIVEKYLDLEKLSDIAREAPPLSVNRQRSLKQLMVNSHSSLVKPGDQCLVTNDQLRIGVIRDSAFQFYYQENLDELKKAGVQLIEFSALKDDLPSNIDAIYIGGGFPETHAERLSSNEKLMQAIKKVAYNGLPIYAECGGLIYLAEELNLNSKAYPMTGVLPLIVGVSKKPQGHGYTVAEVCKSSSFFKRGQVLHGHEFHYSHILEIKKKRDTYFSFKMKKGQGIINEMDGFCWRNVLATYTHLHALGTKEWVDGMINSALNHRSNNI